MRFKLGGISLLCLVMILVTACGSSNTTNSSGSPSPSEPSSPQQSNTEDKSADEVFVLRASTPATEGSLNHQGFLMFKEEAEKRSNGRLKVEVFAGATLVNGNREEIEGVQRGDIAYISPSSAPFVGFVPSVAIFDLPFLFPSMEVAYEVTNNGEVIKQIKKDLEAQGMVLLGVIPSGFRHLTTQDTVVKTPDDLKGIKIRTMENNNHISMWKALGANPTPISFAELYTALEQGTVDAQENPVSLIYDTKFYETQKNLTLTGHIINVGLTVFSKEIFDSLPEDLQKVVQESAEVVNKKAFDLYLQGETEYVEKLKEVGMQVTELTVEEKKAFQEKAQVAVELVGEQVGMDLVNSLLQEIDQVAKSQ